MQSQQYLSITCCIPGHVRNRLAATVTSRRTAARSALWAQAVLALRQSSLTKSHGGWVISPVRATCRYSSAPHCAERLRGEVLTILSFSAPAAMLGGRFTFCTYPWGALPTSTIPFLRVGPGLHRCMPGCVSDWSSPLGRHVCSWPFSTALAAASMLRHRGSMCACGHSAECREQSLYHSEC